MKSHEYFILLGIGVSILLGGVYIVMNLDNQNGNSRSDIALYQNNSITPLEKYIDITERLSKENISFDTIPHNTRLNFQVGDKFEYSASAVTMSSNGGIVRGFHPSQKINCSVTKKEWINKKECYRIECDTKPGNELFGESMASHEITYMDIKTGQSIKEVSAIKIVTGKGNEIKEEYYTANIPQGIAEVYPTLVFYSPWMLSLNDEFKMEIKTYDKKGDITRKSELEVIGREKCGNHKNCYKVEDREIDKNNKVVSRGILWIDTEKRILIKREDYFRNLKVSELTKV